MNGRDRKWQITNKDKKNINKERKSQKVREQQEMRRKSHHEK